MLRFRVEYNGRQFAIMSVVYADGTNLAAEFLDSLDSRDRPKMDALFERMGDTGKIQNREKFKKLKNTNGLFEFKSFQIRVPCFFGRNHRIYLLFGLWKKTDDLKPSEVERAENCATWTRTQLGE